MALVILAAGVFLALERVSPGVVALQGATQSHASGYAGSVFRGDGFSVRIPDAYGMQHSRQGGADAWLGTQDDGQPIAFSIMTIRNLLPFEQSLEGALGRARSGANHVGETLRNETPVTLPGGEAYRYESDFQGVSTFGYVLYRGSNGLMMSTIYMSAELAEQVASTIEFR